jgi:hypothetical protein
LPFGVSTRGEVEVADFDFPAAGEGALTQPPFCETTPISNAIRRDLHGFLL